VVAYASKLGDDGSGVVTQGVVRLARARPDRSIDLLLTPDWPHGVHNRVLSSALPTMPLSPSAEAFGGVCSSPEVASNLAELSTTGSPLASVLARALHPRYHFAGTRLVHYARAPYVNSSDPQSLHEPREVVTRFIALGPVPDNPGAKGGPKWIHALALAPGSSCSSEELCSAPEGSSLSPYLGTHPLPVASSGESSAPAATSSSSVITRIFGAMGPPPRRPAGGKQTRTPRAAMVEAAMDIDTLGPDMAGSGSSATGGVFFRDDHRRGKRGRDEDDPRGGRREPITEQRVECWFCPASKEFSKELVLSISEEAYLTLPKGPVDEFHVLIVPVTHVPSMAMAPPSVVTDVGRYVQALRKWYASHDRELVMFERAVRTRGSAHAHLQVFGVPRGNMKACLDAFVEGGRESGIAFAIVRDGSKPLAELAGEDQYFVAQVPGHVVEAPDLESARLFHKVPRAGSHPLQFGRKVVCDLMGLPNRLRWNECALSPEQERVATQRARDSFRGFDFTMES
jgi:diadenosine tetraphosphate (Ap4A) HIT family hydrolase